MGNESSQCSKPLGLLEHNVSNREGLTLLEPNAASVSCGGTSAGDRVSLGAGSALPKFAAEYPACFERFDWNRDGRLDTEELRSLVEAVCDVWQVAPPETEDLLRAFERHRAAHLEGLCREGFAACANELLASMLETHPGLRAPSISAILLARRKAASRLMLHVPLPTAMLPLRAMGAAGVSVMLAEVWGLPGARGELGRDGPLSCAVVVQRRGRLLPRRCQRTTAVATRSSLGLRGEPCWRFCEELVFDDPALLRRRGELHGCLTVRSGSGRPLAVALSVPVPTAGIVDVELVHPVTGQVEGKACLGVGFACSDPLADFVASELRHDMRQERWAEARRALQLLGPEAVERVAGRPDERGRTLLMLAARCEAGTPLLRDLLALRAPAWLAADALGGTAAHYAAFGGSLEALAALLGSGLAPDSPAAGLGGATPLMLAALQGRADHVRLLLGYGARPEHADGCGLLAAAWGLGGGAACAALAAWATEGDPEAAERELLLAALKSSEAEAEGALEAAASEAGVPRLVCALFGGGSASRPTANGHLSRAVRVLRLATDRGHAALAREVMTHLPGDLPWDDWREPVVLGGEGALLDCPVCMQPLPGRAVALLRTPEAGGCTEGPPAESALACSHFVCEGCSNHLGGRCPLCRGAFAEVQPLPDPRVDPAAWFRFVHVCSKAPPVGSAERAGAAAAEGSAANTSRPSGNGRAWRGNDEDEADCEPSTASSSTSRQGSYATAMGAARRFTAEGGYRGRPPGAATAPLSRADLEQLLPVTVPLDPQLLAAALDGGLWAEWDVDGDGRLSREDFFDPERGLLRWLLVHLHRHHASLQSENLPAPGNDPIDWLHRAADRRGFLQRGDVLCILLALAGVSSLDRQEVQRMRRWIEEHWSKWDPCSWDTFSCEAEDLARRGLAGELLDQAAHVRVRRALARLSECSSEAGKQAEALAHLCRAELACGGLPPGAPGGGRSRGADVTVLSMPEAGDAVRRVRQMCATGDQVLYRDIFPLALAALERHPGHPQVVGWACRAITILMLGLCKAAAAVPPEEATWPRLISAVRAGGLDPDVATHGCRPGAVATHLVRAAACLGASPRGAVDQAFLGTIASVGLLLWLVDAAEPEAAIPQLVGRLPLDVASPIIRGFACATTCLLLCDAGGVADQLRAWDHETSPALVWMPPCTLPPGQVGMGTQVEVCCQGGWLAGRVARAPEPQPSQPRDECWVVECENKSKVYSRHVWRPGWRVEANKALERLRLAVLARALCPGPPRPPAPAARRALLEGVVVRGLGPRAAAPALSPQGPVVRGTGTSVRAGDKVWLSISVERARQLQTQRHGDWSDQMAFCLDCPGRALETLGSPPRVRVSHGSLGTFLWDPAAVTRAESSAEPLPFEEQHGPLVVGDEVLLCASQERVVPLQVGHGGWSTRMAHCLGRFGRVATLNNRGDVRLDTPGCGAFLWNPSALEPAGGGCAAALCAQAVARLDDEGAAVLLLVCLGELAAGEERAEAVADVLGALQRASSGGPVLPALRAYGALALLALAVDLRAALTAAQSAGAGGRALGGSWPDTPDVRLPRCCTPELLATLQATPAMEWPPEHTGGIAFRDVVAGHVDAAAAAPRWALAFFAARHRRLLDSL